MADRWGLKMHIAATSTSVEHFDGQTTAPSLQSKSGRFVRSFVTSHDIRTTAFSRKPVDQYLPARHLCAGERLRITDGSRALPAEHVRRMAGSVADHPLQHVAQLRNAGRHYRAVYHAAVAKWYARGRRRECVWDSKRIGDDVTRWISDIYRQ